MQILCWNFSVTFAFDWLLMGETNCCFVEGFIDLETFSSVFVVAQILDGDPHAAENHRGSAVEGRNLCVTAKKP